MHSNIRIILVWLFVSAIEFPCVVHCGNEADPGKIDGIPCESSVFCHGKLIETIQLSGIFGDSKEFVDRPLRVAAELVTKEFEKLLEKNKRIPPDVLQQFIDDRFEPVGADLDIIKPHDWKDPKELGGIPLLDRITDRNLRAWAIELHGKWLEFGRKTANNISDYPDRHSLIELPHPFISPGEVKGRFREQHYWDSYWVIHGLLISNMTQTARGMILNFASLVDRIGYVPIGNRVYYQNRPQMPMLAAMVKLYWLHTAPGSDALIQQVLPAIEKEYYFWSTSRSVDVAVNGKIFKMARYKSSTSKQRPESYREDHETARSLRNRSTLGVEGKFYANVAAASESGWEFSTRWLDQPHKSMTEIRTEDIIPVDLNAAMCLTEHHLATFYKILGDERKFSEFTTKAIQRGDAIQAVFWNEGLNMWRDFDLKYHKPRKEFYMSNIAPLFAACSSSTVNLMETNFLQRIVASNDIKRSTSFPGGVPVSFVRAEESCHSCQWDFPNMWPTMQLMLIESLARNSDLKPLASTWAQNMIGVIHGGYMQHGNMFEKYNVNKSGYYGVGGEYAVQNGYASTNGAVLRLLELFPTELSDNGNNEIFDREETVNGVHKEISKERDNLKDSDVFQFDAQLSSAMADTNKKSESASHKREEPSSATGINAEHSPQKLSRLNSGTKYCQSSVQLSVSILLILVINIHI